MVNECCSFFVSRTYARNSTGHFWLSFIMYKINYIAIYNESVFMAMACQVFRYI